MASFYMTLKENNIYFLVQHRKTLIIRKNLSFPDYQELPVLAGGGQKKWIADFESS